MNGTDGSSEIIGGTQIRYNCLITLTVCPNFILVDPNQNGWNPNSDVNVGVSPSPADSKSASTDQPALSECASFYIKLDQR